MSWATALGAWSTRCATVISGCSRTFVSSPARKPTTRSSRASSHPSPTSTSTTRSALRIAPTPQPREWRICSRRSQEKLMARELEMLGGVMDNPRNAGRRHRGRLQDLDESRCARPASSTASTSCGSAVRWRAPSTAHSVRAPGTSLVEEDQVATARQLLESAPGRRADLRLPVDGVVVEKVEADAPTQVVAWKAIPDGWMVVDAGPDTVARIAADCASAGTVIWNGPLGIYEIPAFAKGTRDVARALAAVARPPRDRRRRPCCGGPGRRCCRQDRLYQHRWRCDHRVPRGADAAGRRSAPRSRGRPALTQVRG